MRMTCGLIPMHDRSDMVYYFDVLDHYVPEGRHPAVLACFEFRLDAEGYFLSESFHLYLQYQRLSFRKAFDFFYRYPCIEQYIKDEVGLIEGRATRIATDS